MGIKGQLPVIIILVLAVAVSNAIGADMNRERPAWMKGSVEKLEAELIQEYGKQQRERIETGLDQVSDFWHAGDGDAGEFEEFVMENFAGDRETLDAMFDRFENMLEKLDGYMNAVTLALRRQTDLDLGPVYPFDEIFAGYDASAHITDDFFGNKLAFIVLLNFPLTTLEERLEEGKQWSRRQWAEARLAQRFSKRIPAEVNLEISRAEAESDQYIADYNIWMHHLLDRDGGRMFPAGMRLLSHWNLRDEIKANYENGQDGLAKQRMIQKVMERIITQTIPEVVVNNAYVDWDPFTNKVTKSDVNDSGSSPPREMTVSNAPEPDTRYRILRNCFLASRMADPFSPTAPSLIARRFDEHREIPEDRVREILVQVVSSKVVGKIAKIIEKRLDRPLEPFDIWYNGFRTTGDFDEEELNRIVSGKYPTADAYWKDIPALLMKLGFSKERAASLAGSIVVEAARGSGHAWGGEMRNQKARLRTRVGKGGVDYKGFNIAVHEMGHNVEQVISLNDVDYTLLKGVPNTAFTEAFAFVFQAKDLELLGLDLHRDEQSEAVEVLNDFWMTYEIAGVALVDMAIWHWMYDNPDAATAELKDAVIRISKDIWDRYYAPVFGARDVILLSIYSHIIHSFLYVPDYPIGHLIAFQIKEQMKEAGNIGSEFERMARMGRIAPDLWMMKAAGSPVSADALVEAAEHALKIVKQ